MEATPQYNIKDWLAPHMAGRFRNHSKPLWFKFKSSEGTTRMHYKMWVQDKWLPEQQYGADGCTVDDDSKGLIWEWVKKNWTQFGDFFK